MSTSPRTVPPHCLSCVCLASLCLVNRHSFGAREWRWHVQTPGSSARPGGRARGGAGPGAPSGLRAHAPHLGEARRAGAQRGGSGWALKPRAGKSWTVQGPCRAELSPAPPPRPPPPPPGLQQIARERLREAPVQPWRDRSNHPSVSNSFPAGGATAPRARGPRAEVSCGRPAQPSPAPPEWAPSACLAPARLRLASLHLGAPTQGMAGSPPPSRVYTCRPTCRGGRPGASGFHDLILTPASPWS